MDTLEAMRVFVAVVERNGFSAAAQDMSTAGVTRQVAALEKRLSTRLLHRTTRRVSPTSTGAAYYAQCVRLLAEFDALEASIGAQALEPSGTLRINAPVSWGIARLGPLLASYRERFPQVELDLALSDRLVDMVEEGYDVAIRITREPGPTLIARRLGESRVSLCAAPAYLAARGAPQTPQDLQAHACLGYSYWAAGDHWPLQARRRSKGRGEQPAARQQRRRAARSGDCRHGRDPAAGFPAGRRAGRWPAGARAARMGGRPDRHLRGLYQPQPPAPKVRSFIDHLVETGV